MFELYEILLMAAGSALAGKTVGVLYIRRGNKLYLYRRSDEGHAVKQTASGEVDKRQYAVVASHLVLVNVIAGIYGYRRRIQRQCRVDVSRCSGSHRHRHHRQRRGAAGWRYPAYLAKGVDHVGDLTGHRVLRIACAGGNAGLMRRPVGHKCYRSHTATQTEQIDQRKDKYQQEDKQYRSKFGQLSGAGLTPGFFWHLSIVQRSGLFRRRSASL